jgi:hypothetical protein
MVLLMINVMTTGSVYGTQPLGKYLKKLGVFVILTGLSSILVVIIPLVLLGDNVWRKTESFPVIPLRVTYQGFKLIDAFLNGTLNWLAIHNDIPITWYPYRAVEIITVEQIVIVSLDLGTKTYNQYKLSQGFDEVPPAFSALGVLGDCLCFSYSYKETDFII